MYSDYQRIGIVNNVVEACRDNKRLNKTGYNYLKTCSGFEHLSFDQLRSSPISIKLFVLENGGQNINTKLLFQPRDTKAFVYKCIIDRICLNYVV